MREIKFRAWDIYRKRMFEVKGLKQTPINTWEVWDGELAILPCNIQLMQYTGLHDKNDKEIYEGDICKVVSISYSKRIGEVKFHRGCFIISFGEQADGYNSDMLYVPLKVEVVGNIYENPELMEAK